jgi:hypothetical protein
MPPKSWSTIPLSNESGGFNGCTNPAFRCSGSCVSRRITALFYSWANTRPPLQPREVGLIFWLAITGQYEQRFHSPHLVKRGKQALERVATQSAQRAVRFKRSFKISIRAAHALSNASIAESSRSRRAAAVFSSRCFSFEVPGIGSITGDFMSNHASAIWAGVAMSALAIFTNAP